MGSATPMEGATPAAAYTPGVTHVGAIDVATPTPSAINLCGNITPEQYNLLRWEKVIEERNRPLSDEELDTMFPLKGYKILGPPAFYRKTALRQLTDKAREFGAADLATMIAVRRPDIDNIDGSLVEIIEYGHNDVNNKVRTITALSLAALAEAAAPYSIESFDSVLKPLWKGI
ncbi:hypothetical protein Ddye_007748 [Dipteronia dyeriana]|uniref:Splicing factor 3B subunit 1 domain-containing protein n=1 Tax=Dipteronia dyeriana TaxID=168575 RepID=A0AAD9XKN0_9ROSI|nr:hypothetical protein Ddye_007748 [Dipteronia dyeriana]